MSTKGTSSKRRISEQKLHSIILLCSLAALLLCAAVFISHWSASQPASTVAAATALGDVQGVPPGYTGQLYPDYPICYINYSTQYGPPYGPVCLGNDMYNFNSAAFSINAASTPTKGETQYLRSTFVGEQWVQGPDLGPSFPFQSCPNGTLADGDGNCYVWICPAGLHSDPRTPSLCDNSSGAGIAFGTQKYTGHETSCYGPVLDENGNAITIGGKRGIGPAGGQAGVDHYDFPSGYSLANGDMLATPQEITRPKSGFQGGVFDHCYAWRWEPDHVTTAAPIIVGSMPAVNPGDAVTFEWSCLPSRAGAFEVKTGQGIFSEGGWHTGYMYITGLATGVTGGGPGFSPSGYTGKQTVTMPSQKGVYDYTLTCAGLGAPPMDILVDVGNAAVPPIVSITANGQTGAVHVPANQPVNITGSFLPGTGDILMHTAVNGCTTPDIAAPDTSCQNAVTNNTTAASPKSFTFTPSAPGSYYFYPAVQTQLFSPWNNYGKKVTVVADCSAGQQITVINGKNACVPSSVCANGTGQSGSCTACFAGFHLSGGQCIPDIVSCPGGQINPPLCTICAVGFHNDANNICVPNTCADPHAVAPLCNTCISGYQMRGGVCTLIPPAISLSVGTPSVRKGSADTASWSVSGLVAASGEQCSIRSNPPGVFSSFMLADTAPTWSGTNVATGPVTGLTILTLSCTGTPDVSATIHLIPEFQEN